jgi:hypothetical protein
MRERDAEGDFLGGNGSRGRFLDDAGWHPSDMFMDNHDGGTDHAEDREYQPCQGNEVEPHVGWLATVRLCFVAYKRSAVVLLWYHLEGCCGLVRILVAVVRDLG